MASAPNMDPAICERLVRSAAAAASSNCRSPAAAPGTTSTADSLAAVANSIALATFALAIIVAFATLGWFVYVRHRTREEAKREVEKVAPAHIQAYLEMRLPVLVAEAVAAVATDAPGRQANSAEDQGRALSEDPR
jgi:heme/copper-type cytochrome/quinol oxidase subunit 2